MVKEEAMEKLINEGHEALFYFAIDQIGAYVWRTNHDLCHGRYESTPSIDEALATAPKDQIRLVKAMKKFGFEGFLDEKDFPTQTYWDWYNWWHRWHTDMTNEEWDKVNAMLDDNMTPEQIAYCRPPGTWKKEPQ